MSAHSLYTVLAVTSLSYHYHSVHSSVRRCYAVSLDSDSFGHDLNHKRTLQNFDFGFSLRTLLLVARLPDTYDWTVNSSANINIARTPACSHNTNFSPGLQISMFIPFGEGIFLLALAVTTFLQGRGPYPLSMIPGGVSARSILPGPSHILFDRGDGNPTWHLSNGGCS